MWLCKNYAFNIYLKLVMNVLYNSKIEMLMNVLMNVPTCFHKRIPKPCLSVCPSVCLSIYLYPEKRNHHSFVNISPTLVIDISMERYSRVLRHGNPKLLFFFFSKKFKIRILTFDEELKSP